jgi:integrase/recombinase XerD
VSLLRAAKDHSERDWLMLLVGFWHGLRVSEILALTPESIRAGYITVQRLKGSLKTTQPLVSNEEPLLDEAAALRILSEKTGAGVRLFSLTRQHFWRRIRKHCKTAGIPDHKAHPHVLKHSIAMQTIKSAGIENVRQYLGHKSISSTGAYLRVDDDAASRAIAGAAASAAQKDGICTR